MKTILLVDSVAWDPIYPVDHPLRNVPQWFQRHFVGQSELAWRVVNWELVPQCAELDGIDGVLISGSPRDAWADCPENDRLCGLVRECLERELALLGVCYGHQILGRVLGAPVGRHPEGLQLGPVEMELTAAGVEDPLFAGMESRFEALSGHVDYVAKVPEEAELLASGGVTEVQAFRCGSRQYGVQFHPEMSAAILGFLWQARVELWRDRVDFDLAARIASFHDTPDAPRVLTNFVERIV